MGVGSDDQPRTPTPGGGTRATIRGRLADFVTLERSTDRRLLGSTLIVLTLLSPYISLPGGLPAVQLEQVALVLAAVPVAALLRRHPELRRIGLVDLGFLALTVATTLTLILAPLVIPGGTRSFRDIFELVRIAEYWLVYRIGLTIVPTIGNGDRLARLLAIAAIGLGIFAVGQYLNPPGLNDVLTMFWTQAHNLTGVTQEGRAVGTAGNANQFGALAVLLLFLAMSGRIGPSPARDRWIWISAIAASTVCIVLAQSRGAILGALAGVVVAGVVLLTRRMFLRSVVRSVPGFLVGFVFVVALVMIVPPASGSVLSRFNISAMLRDPSVVIRIGRAESILSGPSNAIPTPGGDPAACQTTLMPDATPLPDHVPASSDPAFLPNPDANQLAGAVAAYYCGLGVWPSGIGGDLVPTYISQIPNPPSGGQWGVYSSTRGFDIGASSPTDTASDSIGAGSLPNLLANPSFEQTGNPPPNWLTTPGASAAPSTATPAFGATAVEVHLPPRGAIYQLVVADLPTSTPYTVGLWVRPIDPGPVKVQLYIVALTAAGARIEPLAARTIDVAAGGWQHVTLSFQTPADHLFSLQIMARAPAVAAHMLLDGASLTEGPYALPFSSLVDEPAIAGAASDLPLFRQSPIVGVGPQKDTALAVFDNEYISFLFHYGILGILAYLALFGAAFIAMLRAAHRDREAGGLLGIALAAFTVALGVTAISAGSYRQLQIMVIYWLLVGVAAATASSVSRREPSAEST